MLTFQVFFLCMFLHFGRGQNIPSSSQNQLPKLIELLKLQVQIEKASDVLHKECPTLLQLPDVSSVLKPVVGKRQLYFGASSEEIKFRTSLAKHTLDFLMQSYLKCKAVSLKVTTPVPDPCNSQPCKNNEACLANGDTAICACLPGFSGTTCDIPVGIDGCISNPCHSGSTCQNRHGHFECVCPAGFAGNLCQHEISECSSRPCQRGGTCVDLVNDYRCICPVGHYGKHCEVVIHCHSQPCQNGATCVNGNTTYTCICPQAYTGRNCEIWTKCPPGGSIRIVNTLMGFQYDPAMKYYSSWMRDSQPTNPSDADRVWFFKDYEGNNVVAVYENVEAMKRGKQSVGITLPYNWAGTGQVVYRGSVYFQRFRTKNVVKYDIQKKMLMAEINIKELDNGYTCNYQWGDYTTADFAVDEYGLWLVYGNISNNCNLVIAKINPDTLNVENSWATNISSRRVENSFMKCGVLYATSYVGDTSNYIHYTYDTNIEIQETLSSSKIPFRQPGTNTAMLDYNPHDGFLYYADYDDVYLATFLIV